jgi:Phage portal protein
MPRRSRPGCRPCTSRQVFRLCLRRVNLRALRPRANGNGDVVPNENDPAMVPPSTVGPDQLVTPGDPHGVTVEATDDPGWLPPTIRPSGWSGWPAEWATPNWGGGVQRLTDTAWMCIDLNSSLLSTMPPYLVNAAPTLNADWLNNPEPDLYASWEEFAKQLWWDFQLGEVFVRVTASYSTGWPARFHVVPPWTMNVEMDTGRRVYSIGALEAGQYRQVAAEASMQYCAQLVSSGGIPVGVLESQEEISPEQALLIQQQWVARRMSTLGEPAVLDKGLVWKPSQLNPTDMALLDLEKYHDGRIASLLGVPGPLVGLPGFGDTLTYSNITSLFDFHWRAGLRPKAQTVMAALSGWALPRGTRVEVNRDAYVQPGPLERAQTAQILSGIVDPATGRQALTVDEIRAAERLDNSTPTDVAQGVLR